jgi:hypothetical protein
MLGSRRSAFQCMDGRSDCVDGPGKPVVCSAVYFSNTSFRSSYFSFQIADRLHFFVDPERPSNWFQRILHGVTQSVVMVFLFNDSATLSVSGSWAS